MSTVSSTKFEVSHPCGARVRVEKADALRCPICPRCKQPVEVPWWQKLRARAGGAKLSASQKKAEFNDIWGQPSADVGFQEELIKLAHISWAGDFPKTQRPFLFKPELLLICDEEVLKEGLEALYEHARIYVPGLEVSFRVPELRIAKEDGAAGHFNVDEAGWLSIDISPDFRSVPKAMWVILAHEVCHHILNLSSLADKCDTTRDERLTDAAMFICGFGDIVKLGQTFTQRMASGYQKTHLGYLRPSEYSYAYHWVIAARSANNLSGMKGTKISFPSLASGFRSVQVAEILLEKLRCRVPDGAARERLLKYYRMKFPNASLEEIYSHALDSYERDSR